MWLIFLTTIFLSSAPVESALSAEPVPASTTSGRHPDFVIPELLRGRVNFWKDVFATHGKLQKIVHHRRFPQIRYKVLDFSKASEQLSGSALEDFIDRMEEKKIAEVRGYLRNLANTGKPSNEMEAYIAEQMKWLPGGRQKYLDALEDKMVRTQTGIKEKYARAVKRTGRYLGIMEQIFINEFSLPPELTRIPFIESSFDYTAYSSAGAAGMWQFMPRTAKKYMTVNHIVDERLDPIISTRSAARYLTSAYRTLGTWPMAVTSYNHGVAGVNKRMREAGSRDLPKVIERTYGEPVFGFASTNFWPEVLAAIEIYDNWKKYFPEVELYPQMETVEHRVRAPVYITQAAKQFGVSREDLVAANYALRPPVTAGKKLIPAGYTLRIPRAGIARDGALDEVPLVPSEERVMARASSSVIHGVTEYTVRKGDTLKSIAKRFRTSVKEVMAHNNLSSPTIRVGQKLSVHSAAIDTIGTGRSLERQVARVQSKEKALDSSQAKRAKAASAVASQRAFHKVRSGDTLSSIAKKHGTSVSALRALNGIKGSNISVGRSIRVR